MFGNSKNKEAKKIIKEIEAVEKKRARSQAELVQAILNHKSPDDETVDYFNKYSAEIDMLRDKLHKIQNSK